MNLHKIKMFLLVLGIIVNGSIMAQSDPIGQAGIPTIIELFKQKPIVAIGETHGHLQFYEFLDDLVQTEDFYKNVNHILIESGNSFYQETLDKYINGEKVAFEDLQKVWLNTTQSPVDAWSVDIYYHFLTTIRSLNSRISKNNRIRVIAADPPIVWENTHTNEEYVASRGSRNEYYAQQVITEILSKNYKALLINGGAHFGNHNTETVNQKIEKVYPNSTVVVLATAGLWKGNEDKERQLNWSVGTIAKVKDTWIGLLPGPKRMTMMAPSNSAVSNERISNASTIPAPSLPSSDFKRQDYFDYVLYLGEAKDLTYGEVDTSIYQSEQLWKELNRRSMIRFNHKLIEGTRKTGELRPEAYE